MEQEAEAQGRLFREAWIRGVHSHFPGTPKPGSIAPWDEMPEWEQQAAIAVYARVRALILAGFEQEPPARLTPEQGGRYVSEAWNVQVYRHVPNPKPGYVADWEDLPSWQRATDRDIFVAIEQIVLQEATQA
jgi:hypothetical protein